MRHGAVFVFCMSCAALPPRGTVPVEQAAALPRVVVQVDDAASSVYLEAMIRAGSGYDAIGQEGLAAITAATLEAGGAGERTADEVKQALFVTGNRVQTVVGKEHVTYRLRCHRDDAEHCMSLFADIVTAPRLEDEVVGRVRARLLHALSDGAADDDARLARWGLDAMLFEGHRYGHPTLGRHGVLGGLAVADVRRFHQEHYVRQSTVLGIAGAVTNEQVNAFVQRFEGLGGRLPPDDARLRPLATEGRRLLAIETGSDLVSFRLGHHIEVDRDHPDFAALYLAMASLGAHGGGFGTLAQSMREARGLNDGAYAYVEPYEERVDASMPEQGMLQTSPYFHLWIQPTVPENALFSLGLALHELELLVDRGLESQRLEDTRSYLEAALDRMAVDPGRRLAYAVEAEAAGQPNLLDQLDSQLASLTPASVHAALARHVRPDAIDIVMVGGGLETLMADVEAGRMSRPVYADGMVAESVEEVDGVVVSKPLVVRLVRTTPLPAELLAR